MIPGEITFVDQTLREGMQYRGIVFSLREKEAVLRYQHRLGVDICQAGYPPAHASEQKSVTHLQETVVREQLSIRVAAMGRANPRDVDALVETGVSDFHLHAHIPPDADEDSQKREMDRIEETITALGSRRPGCVVSMAMLDLGRTPPAFLSRYGRHLIHGTGVKILSLPDTSGMMAPHRFRAAVAPMAAMAKDTGTAIGVHCHNDLGMATANTVMGVTAGATVVEASALGIGERNGIADIFTLGKVLKDEGFSLNLRTDKVEVFREYYLYVDEICRRQTGEGLFSYNTPFFGDAVTTHVAGTHADTPFGGGGTARYFLNVLCGRGLVKKYLTENNISFAPASIGTITTAVKDASARRGRRLSHGEICDIVNKTPSV